MLVLGIIVHGFTVYRRRKATDVHPVGLSGCVTTAGNLKRHEVVVTKGQFIVPVGAQECVQFG